MNEGEGLSNRQGWLVAGLLVCCFVLAPLAVWLRPQVVWALGYRDAYLALAMLPGLALGAGGVWAATR